MAKNKMSDMAPMMPSVHMDHETLKQFGMHKGALPKVGAKLKMSAMAHVKSVGESEQGRHMQVELHDMNMEHGGGAQPGVEDGDTEQATAKGMKGAIDKALKPAKEKGSESAKRK